MPNIQSRIAAYVVAVLPAIALAAEQAVNSTDPWAALIMQLGVGGLVAVMAVKVALMLYKDKERASAEYHQQVLALTKQQIEEIARSRTAIEKLEEAIETHNNDFRNCIETLTTISGGLTKRVPDK